MRKRKGDNPDKIAHREGATAALKRAFLDQLKVKLFVTQACDAAGVSRTTVYEWKEKDPEFRAAMEAVDARFVDMLQSEATRRAVIGEDKPVTVAGKREVIKEKSDFLLNSLLRAKVPAFRDSTRVDVNVNFLQLVVGKLTEIVQRVVPIKCSNCGHVLPARKDMARELEAMTIEAVPGDAG